MKPKEPDATRLRWVVGVLCLSVAALVLWWTLHEPQRTTGVPASGESAAVAENKLHEGNQTDESGLALPEAERNHIWEIEHRVLVLDFRFWPALSAAIREQDRERVRGFFVSGATAELINPEKVETESLEFGQLRAVSAAAAGRLSVPLDELVDHLVLRMDDFDSDRRVSIRTVFLSPKNRDHPEGGWRGRFLLRAWGQSKNHRPSEFVLEADFELAALTDDVPSPAPWLTTCHIVSESFRQAGHYLFAEVAKSWGLDADRFHDNWLQRGATPHVMTGGIYATDYDQDGKTDLFVTDIKGNVLYRQVGPGKFEDTTWEAGLDDLPAAAAIAWADLDGDGYPDLVANNQLLRNTGRGAFERVGVLPLTHMNRLHGFATADFDRDGLVDIYVARAAPDPLEGNGRASWLDDRTGPGNTLLKNLGGWKFEDVTTSAGAAAGSVSCLSAAWFDANDDLWPDLFVGDEFGSPVLLVNRQDGTFESRTITGDFGGFNMGVATGDLDNDGHIDLYLANMYSKAGERVLSNLNLGLYPPDLARRIQHIVDGSELWHNCGDLRFESKGRASGVARVGWSYGPRIADFDNDGRLDIYAPAGFYSVSRDEPDG